MLHSLCNKISFINMYKCSPRDFSQEIASRLHLLSLFLFFFFSLSLCRSSLRLLPSKSINKHPYRIMSLCVRFCRISMWIIFLLCATTTRSFDNNFWFSSSSFPFSHFFNHPLNPFNSTTLQLLYSSGNGSSSAATNRNFYSSFSSLFSSSPLLPIK